MNFWTHVYRVAVGLFVLCGVAAILLWVAAVIAALAEDAPIWVAAGILAVALAWVAGGIVEGGEA